MAVFFYRLDMIQHPFWILLMMAAAVVVDTTTTMTTLPECWHFKGRILLEDGGLNFCSYTYISGSNEDLFELDLSVAGEKTIDDFLG